MLRKVFDSKETIMTNTTQSDRYNNGIIAFQGKVGAFSHLCTKANYPDCHYLPCETFEQAFDRVLHDEADLAMIPIENSAGGRVADIHLILPNYQLFVIAEHYYKVEHCLMVNPNVTLEDISEVISHPQALAQCRKKINDLKLLPKNFSDTAGAAQHIAKTNDTTHAAIASKLAAETYGLKILFEDFQDEDDNTTRFIVLSKDNLWAEENTKTVTSVIFTVKSIPASLYKSLGGFATNNVDLIKLESYIPLHETKIARFYIEFIGHPMQKNVKLALEELEFFTTYIDIIGVYAYNRP